MDNGIMDSAMGRRRADLSALGYLTGPLQGTILGGLLPSRAAVRGRAEGLAAVALRAGEGAVCGPGGAAGCGAGGNPVALHDLHRHFHHEEVGGDVRLVDINGCGGDDAEGSFGHTAVCVKRPKVTLRSEEGPSRNEGIS